MKRQTRYTKAIALVGLSLMLLAGVGCKKSTNDNSAQITGRAGRGSSNVVGETTQYNTQTGQTTSQASYVTSSSNYSSEFQSAVKQLVSGQIDPSLVGSVSPTTGVMIRGYIVIDASGNINTASSRLALEVRDEYTGQTDSSGNSIPSITMTLPGASGRAYNGQFQMTFRDSIGDILVQGSFANGGVSTGQVYFANYKKWDGSTVSNPQYVGLGSFSIQTCGFFHCQ